VRQSRTYYIYIFGKDVNNFLYLGHMATGYLALYNGANMVCSSNSPKLAKNEAVLLMATDTHGTPSTP
jgi:hypothetical protein